MSKTMRHPAEPRERAIRLVREHRDEHASEWAAIQSIAGKLGITPEALRLWVRRDAVDHGRRSGVMSAELAALSTATSDYAARPGCPGGVLGPRRGAHDFQ
jgi:transposase